VGKFGAPNDRWQLFEVPLIESIFSDKHKPTDFGHLVGNRKIPLLGYILVVTFAILILSVTRIEIFCFVALALHTTDLIGNGLVLQNINRAIAQFKIVEDSEAQFVRERRQIMVAYYFGNQTIPRTCCTAAITIIALALAVYSSDASPYKLYAAYALMIINIVVSEAIMRRWRARRDKALDAVAAREEDHAISTSAALAALS
jgi:hypothetical protein